MTALFTIDLTINMPDGDRHTKQLLNLYFTDMSADIDAIAYHLCGSDKDVQARKFAHLIVKRADVWAGQEGSLKVFALLSVSSEGPAFIKQVVDKYMEAFPECLKKASHAYFSHNSFPPGISLQPTDWSVEVH